MTIANRSLKVMNTAIKTQNKKGWWHMSLVPSSQEATLIYILDFSLARAI